MKGSNLTSPRCWRTRNDSPARRRPPRALRRPAETRTRSRPNRSNHEEHEGHEGFDTKMEDGDADSSIFHSPFSILVFRSFVFFVPFVVQPFRGSTPSRLRTKKS